MRRVICRILEREGSYAIAEAEDGEEAIRLIRDAPPHAVILDISMPGVTGLGVISSVREISSDIKIIVLSSLYGMEKEILSLGADAFLPKTAPPKKVLGTLEQLLSA